MKKLLNSLVLTSAITLSAVASSVVTVVQVNSDIGNIGVESKLWTKAKQTKVLLYPQTTIVLNDKKANAANAKNGAKEAMISAITDGKNIAFKVKWADGTQSVQSGNAVKNTEFPDGFAVQFAQKYNDPAKLPYIGMGSKDRPVVVYLQKNVKQIFEPNNNGDVALQVSRNNSPYFGKDLQRFDLDVAQKAKLNYKKAFIAEGFRSTTEIKDGSAHYNMDMKYANQAWSGTLVRSLNDDYIKMYNDPIPVAFAVWDGDQMGRDGLKHLSAWVIAEFPGNTGEDKLKKEFDRPLDKANVKKGEELVKANCASCHNYANESNAPAYMAPNLSNIGGYSTTPYLIESIIDPDAVVVPGYNVNAHANTPWYNLDENGNRKSAMPSFSWMTPGEIDDMVVFLKTLKVGVKK